MISKLTLKLSFKAVASIGLLGLLLLCAGVYLGFKVMPDIITSKIWEMKILKENTEQWELFMKVPFPFMFKVYLFDIQNPEKIFHGERPVVKEKGPYVYRVYKWKSDVEWNADETISFYSYMRFEFDQEASGSCSEDDTATILNTPYYTMLLTVEEAQASALSMVADAAPEIFGGNSGLFVKVNVRDYLFDGIKMCENGGQGAGFAAGMVCKQIAARLTESKNMRLGENNTILFSNMYYKNNTHLGRFTVDSGIGEREQAGVLKLYNGRSHVSAWLGEKSDCNKIRGVTTIFPVHVQKDMVFESFAEDICRVMGLKYKEETRVKGITGYTFAAMNDSFQAAKTENQCFCVNKSRNLDGGFGCLKDGLVDLTTCTGAPVLMSFPHLLHADPEYLSSVDGLQPNVTKHETFLTLEPISGYPLRMAQRIQFNMFIRPLEDVESMENLTKALIPLMWIEESVQLQTDTIQWERFLEIPFGIDFKTWLFNVTNADDILQGAKPILNEVGPYHYIQTVKREVASIDSSDDTVTYQQNITLQFSSNLSGNLTEDDELVLLNPVMLSMGQLTNVLERMALGGCLDKIFAPEHNSVFVKIKVRTILFEGLEFAVNNDDIGVACNIIRNKVLQKTSALRNVEKIYDSSNTTIAALRFAFFQYKVTTHDGIYSITRGLNDVSQLGNIVRWNNATDLPYWGRVESINNDTCNRVRGTDATVYPPYVRSNGSFDIFATDICRVVKINYKGTDTYKGVEAYRFEVNENTFKSATASPENDCFCTKQTADENGTASCFLDGLVDMQPCFGAPILLSFPHFLFADARYMNALSGVEEGDESIHKIYLLVEPNTGTPLEGKKRVQFNAVLRPASFLSSTENLPRVVLPLVWVEEGVSLPQKYIDELNDKYFNKLKVAEGIKYGLIAVSLAAVLTSMGFLTRKTFFTGK